MKQIYAPASVEAGASDLAIERSNGLAKDTLADGWSLGVALLRSPRKIGAVAPSGTMLADAMAREVPNGDGVVIELGGGTGSITAGLLRAGVATAQLVVIERDALLCRRVQERFPQCKVVCGDAVDLPGLLSDAHVVAPVKAVVSSLPVLSMRSAEWLRVLTRAWSVTGGRGPIIQFTYGMRCPISTAHLAKVGATAKRSAWIWQNLPPASVWRIDSDER